MKKAFRSSDFTFVPTALSAALARAGAGTPLVFSREPVVMRNRVPA